jgi:hypothetical protein
MASELPWQSRHQQLSGERGSIVGIVFQFSAVVRASRPAVGPPRFILSGTDYLVSVVRGGRLLGSKATGAWIWHLTSI